MATATMPDYGTVPRTSVEIHGVTFTRHALSEKWPDMGRDQFAELVTDLDTHGQAQPVTMYQDAVLDGWHRIAALSILEVDPLLIEYNGNSAAEFVISLNARRRHLTIGQRVMAVMECIEWRNTGVNSGDTDSAGTMTVAEAASLAGVSSRSVQRAKVVAQDSPEAAERVKTGESSLNEAHKQLRPPKAKAKAETSDAREPTDNMTTCAAPGCKTLLRSDDAVWFESDSYCQPCADAMDAEADTATTPVVEGEQATSKQNKNAIDSIVSKIISTYSAQDEITCLKCGDLVSDKNPATDDGLACATCNVTSDEAMEPTDAHADSILDDNEDSFDEDVNADCPKCESYQETIDSKDSEIKRLRGDLLMARSRIDELETALASR